MLQTFPRGRSVMKGEDLQCCKPSNSPRGKVCNVADLPGEGLQCCRSSGGRYAMLQTSRGKVYKGESLQYNTGKPSGILFTCDHIPTFRCHEYKTDSLYFGPVHNRSLSVMLRKIFSSPVTTLLRVAQRNCYTVWDSKEDIDIQFAATLLCIWMFGGNGGILFWILIKMSLTFERQWHQWRIWFSETGRSLLSSV